MRRFIGTAACFLMIACIFALPGCGPQPEEITKTPLPWAHMPHPNAYDTFNSAIKDLKDAKGIQDANSSTLSPAGHPAKAYPMRAKARVVRKNEAALAKMRKGLKQQFCFPLRYGFDALFPEFGKYRTVAQLLSLEGQVKASRGDWAGALQCYQETMRLGKMIPNGSSLIGGLVGLACQNIARDGIWGAAKYLNGVQAEIAARQMLSLMEAGISWSETLREEKVTQIMALQDVFAGKVDDPDVKVWAKLPRFIKNKALSEYADYMDKLIADVRLPYASKPDMPEVKRHGLLYAPADIILAIMCPGTAAWLADVRCNTENGLMAVTLALQAYRAERGRYPASLAELTPQYLPKLPTDPFAMSGTFRYRRKGSTYVLWSVGPDGKDNGGRAIFDPKAKPGERHRVDEDSKGDVVAGVNR